MSDERKKLRHNIVHHPEELPPLSSELWRDMCECNHSAAVHLVDCCGLCMCATFRRRRHVAAAQKAFAGVRDFMLAHGGREFVCPRCGTQVVTRDPSLAYCPPCEATWQEGSDATDAELELAARGLSDDILMAAIEGVHAPAPGSIQARVLAALRAENARRRSA